MRRSTSSIFFSSGSSTTGRRLQRSLGMRLGPASGRVALPAARNMPRRPRETLLTRRGVTAARNHEHLCSKGLRLFHPSLDLGGQGQGKVVKLERHVLQAESGHRLLLLGISKRRTVESFRHFCVGPLGKAEEERRILSLLSHQSVMSSWLPFENEHTFNAEPARRERRGQPEKALLCSTLDLSACSAGDHARNARIRFPQPASPWG